MQKRRANGEGNITKRKDGLWMAQYTDNIGKRRTVYGKTQQEALKKKNEAQQQSEKGLRMDKSKMTFAEWLIEWLEIYVKPTVKKSTYSYAYSDVYRHILPAFPKVLLKDLRADMLQKFINEKSYSGRCDKEKDTVSGKLVQRRGGLSNSAVNRIGKHISLALKQAVDIGLLANDVSQKVKLPKKSYADVRILSYDEQKKLETVINNNKNPLTFCILFDLYTGLRAGELAGLKISDIDFQKGELIIRRSISRVYDPELKTSNKVVSEPKTKKSRRTIPLPDFLAKRLKTYIDYRQTTLEYIRCKRGEEWVDEGYIFMTVNGETLEPAYYSYLLGNCLKEAGLEHIKFHALRHTFTTRCAENGFDIKCLSEILGHADSKVTLNVYTHALEEKKKSNMDKLGTLYHDNPESN